MSQQLRAERTLRCQALLTASGWFEPAFVTLDAAGQIVAIAAEPKPPGGKAIAPEEQIEGYVVPGLLNGHSHAFQFAMAGLAEHLPFGQVRDDFWSWRESMYGLVLRLDPDQLEAIAAMAYARMLAHGITAVAEFHYVHLDPAGKPYADRAELGGRILAAARQTGIHVTLIPVHYRHGGFDLPPTAGQRRFLSRDLDDYRKLLTATAAKLKDYDDAILGRGLHSLRAVAAPEAVALFAEAFSGPTHLHVAEQQKEVDACKAALGATPVAWLLDHVDLGPSHALVHATHVTDREVDGLARSGATVVLCPSTEGNLGDGFFPFERYFERGGRFAIGTDSQISLSPFEDLRWLDYVQRLKRESRLPYCRQPGEDSGHQALIHSQLGGRQALGLPAAEAFAIGQPFDAAVIDPGHPAVIAKPAERRLAALVYAGDSSALLGVMRRGRWLVKGGRHLAEDEIRRRYRAALTVT